VFDHGDVARVEALAERVRPVDLARDRRLPVLPALDALLPASGLRRGTTVAVDARPGVAGATSLALALAAGASQAGSWVAAVGLGSLGLVAAAELGVAFERLVVIADPGRERAGWASVVAALVDGFDVVLVAAGPGVGTTAGEGPRRRGRLRAGDARRLVARVRERGAVLVAVGGELPGERSPLRLTLTAASWEGLGDGWGHLQGRRVTVEATGRGEAARDRRAELWLPGAGGAVTAADPVAEPIPLHRPAAAEPEPEKGRSA
jgi:4-amino-4-deoxy-L-arabinose transferase-like glycosyltransferase